MPTLAQARAHWWNRQFPSAKAPLAATLGASGWLRTLGGADVYLAARARRPGMRRAELDAAVAAGELRVVPAARGCIYLVPAAIVPDLMALNHDEWHRTAAKDLARIKKSVNDLEPVARAVLGALASGPLTTDAIRKAIDVPSFGDAGKKIGISSPLPLALRSLELKGKVERTLDGGRLDSATYLWRTPTTKLPAPSKNPWLAVVDAFLGFAGPAALSDIAAWSGRAQRDVRDAIIALGVRTIDVESFGEAYLRAGDALDDRPPRGVALLAFEDNYLVNHATLAVVSDPRHHQIPINLWGGGDKPSPIREASHVLTRTIIVDGLIAGFWEVDPRQRGGAWGVWTTFDPPGARADEIDAAVQDAARFLLADIGHAKAYTLDTMELVQERADRIAKMKPGRAAAPKQAPANEPAAKKAAKKPPANRPVAKPKLVAKLAARGAAKKPAKSTSRRA